MLSIQTNTDSLMAQQNLAVNSAFHSATINQLTSGYRINSAADDAAGLAVANGYRNNVAQLNQGVQNANQGVSQLQIIDGGLTNISQILDRLQTLATESASATFTGDRSTLNNEYQSLLTEINRQSSNIGLVSGGTNNNALSVYLGGGSSASNAQVKVDLSGAANQVDSAGLGLASTNIMASGTGLSSNAILLNNAAGNFTGSQNFTFYVQGKSGGTTGVTVAYNGAGVATGDGASAVSKMNTALQAAGLTAITAFMGSDGKLQFSSGLAFSVVVGAGANGIATPNAKAENNAGLYSFAQAVGSITAVSAGSETDVITNAQGSVTLTFDTTTGAGVPAMIDYMNQQLNSIGVYAVLDSAGTGFSLQSSATLTINETGNAGTGAVFGASTGAVSLTNGTPTSAGSSASAAIAQITAAVKQLGQIQGRVGAGENMLNYAINLAQSQITNFSSAQSQIRDANVASAAANLTKAQVLQQASIAAMAQANAEPQAILALLRG